MSHLNHLKSRLRDINSYLHYRRLVFQDCFGGHKDGRAPKDRCRFRSFIGVLDKDYVEFVRRDGRFWITDDGQRIHSDEILAIVDRGEFGY